MIHAFNDTDEGWCGHKRSPRLMFLQGSMRDESTGHITMASSVCDGHEWKRRGK